MTASRLNVTESAPTIGAAQRMSSSGGAERFNHSHVRPTASPGRERLTSLRPITSRIAARLLRNKLVSAAERTVEIAPGRSLPVELAVMLPDEPGRIRGYLSSPALNIERLTSCTFEQGPTRMHLLRDVIIADGSVLTSTSYDRLRAGARSWLLRGEFDRISEAVLCSTYVTQKYFGHWLRDGMSHELLAEDQGVPALVLDSPILQHEPSYRQLLSLQARRTRFAHCDRLWVLEDHEQNAHFIDRFERLRKRIRTQVKAPSRGTERIFIARGDSGKGRSLANSEEVKSTLRQRGWTILEPEREDAKTIASTLANARIVVSPEGSALAHAAVAIPAGAGVLTIIGAQHFNMPYKGLCDALDVRFGITIADAVGAQDFHQPIDRLLSAIDLLETAVDKHSRH